MTRPLHPILDTAIDNGEPVSMILSSGVMFDAAYVISRDGALAVIDALSADEGGLHRQRWIIPITTIEAIGELDTPIPEADNEADPAAVDGAVA